MNPDSISSKGFYRLLDESLPAWAAAERNYFDKQAGLRKDQIVLYGLGDLGRKILRMLRTQGIEPLGIIDSKLAATNAIVENLPCLSPAAGAKRWGDSAVFVISVFNQSGPCAFIDIRRDLEAGGAEKVVYFLPLLWKYAEIFLPYYSLDLPSKILGETDRIKQVFGLLGDERSREDFAFFFETITSPSPERTLPSFEPDRTYFPSDIGELSKKEVFIDCGAFHGDNLVKLNQLTSGKFQKYVGIEPDPLNYVKLRQCLDSLRGSTAGICEIQPYGVGSQRDTIAFDSQGTISSSIGGHGSTTIQIETLDRIIGENVPTSIKMDVEGFEVEALKGGESLVIQFRPKLALCVYHVQNHLWVIPLLIKNMNSEYEIYIRRHREYLDDVVCYAVSR